MLGEAAEGIQPPRARGPEHGLGEIGDVRVGVGPQRLQVGDDAEFGETRQIGGVDQLHVGDHVAALAGGVAYGALSALTRAPELGWLLRPARPDTLRSGPDTPRPEIEP